MVKNGQHQQPPQRRRRRVGVSPVLVKHRPSVAGRAIEHYTLASLQRRPGLRLDRLEQIEFALVIVCRAGAGVHEVDFEEHHVQPGTVIRVRPGQVHRWTPDGYEATLIILAPGTPGSTGWPTIEQVGPETMAQLDRLLLVNDSASETFAADPAGARSLVADLVERLLVSTGRPEPSAHGKLIAGLAELGHSRAVAVHARTLGYCVRTLTRACLAAEGLTAKQVVDRSVILHAKRLLACTHDGPDVLAERLGFADASNFSRFFQHHTGQTPSQWRRCADSSARGR